MIATITETVVNTGLGIIATVVAGMLTFFIYRLIKNVDSLKDEVVLLRMEMAHQNTIIQDKEKICAMMHFGIDERLTQHHKELEELKEELKELKK